jgi:hypothetical protein
MCMVLGLATGGMPMSSVGLVTGGMPVNSVGFGYRWDACQFGCRCDSCELVTLGYNWVTLVQCHA